MHTILTVIGVLAVVVVAWKMISDRPLPILEKFGSGGGDYYSLGAPSTMEFNMAQTSGSPRMGNMMAEAPAVMDEGNLTERKVIKNGNLDLIVKKAEETAEELKILAKELGGFILNVQIYESTPAVKNGWVTMRVPDDKFDEGMTAVKALAEKVEGESVSASDVTEQFIDLEARLGNLQVEEVQLQEVLKRAFTVEDILKVRQQLSSVRGQIEQLEGQLKYLSRQVDMSTITVSLTSEADVEVFGLRWRPLVVVRQAFRDMLESLTGWVDGLIKLIFQLPALLLWLATIGVIVLVVWKILKRIYWKFIKPKNSNE